MKSFLARSLALFVLVLVPAACQTGTPAKAPAPVPVVPREASSDEPPTRELELTNEYVFDAVGNYTRTQVHRYRVLTEGGLDEASDFEAQWQPWYMARPEVSVRVVDPRGGVHPVEAASLVESNVEQSSPGVLSDTRVLRAPLPGLEVGATVEERVVWKTTKPYSPAGVVHSYFFGGPVPVDAARLVIDAPESLPLRHRVMDAKVSFKEEKANGRRRLTFAGGPYPALEWLEPLQVPEVASWPQVAFSTGKSWQDVARVYDATVNRALEGADLTATARSIVTSADAPRAKAQKLLAWARSHVRYADVELGDASYEPAKPSETLRRGYGDCKDQAVLLTGLLRASGLDAHVALVRTGPGEDVREDLPGLGSFDHAIVMVEGKEPIFMDPTASFYPAGVLPSGEQGRLALVVSPSTEGLSRMPALAASANTYTEEREIYFSDYDLGRVVETTTATGTVEATLRASHSGSRESVQSELDRYAKQEYLANGGTKIEFTPANELDRPFRIRQEIPSVSSVKTSFDDAAVALHTRALFSPLPNSILGEDSRKTAAEIPAAFRSEIRYRIVPPKGFVLAELPSFEAVDLGPGKLSRSCVQNQDGSLSAVFRFEIAKTRLAPNEVNALRAGVRALDAQDSEILQFIEHGAKLIAEGKLRDGMDVYRRLLGTPIGHVRYSAALLNAGFVDAARREARKAIELAPNMPIVHQHLGYVLLHDDTGRQFRQGYDRDGAMAESRKAISLGSKDAAARLNLALALVRDANGVQSRDPADLQRAIEQYDAIEPTQLANIAGSDRSGSPLELLLQLGRFDDILRRGSKRPTEGAAAHLRIAAFAASRGVPVAIDEVIRLGLNDESRAHMFASAASYLQRVRRYPEAAALYEIAARTGKNAAAYQSGAKLMRQLRRYETLSLSEKNPEDFVKLAYVRFAFGKGDEPIYAAASDLSPAEIQANIRGFRAALGKLDMPPELLIDVILSTSKWAHEKRGIAEVVHSEISGNKSDFVLVREGGVYRVMSFETDIARGACAGALHALKEQKETEAKPWLDLVRESVGPAYVLDELDAPIMARAWGYGRDVRAATGCLCAQYKEPRETLELLLGSRDRVKDPEQQRAVDHAVTLAALRADDGPRALEASDRLIAALPKSTGTIRLRLDVLRMMNRQDELRSVLKKGLASAPSDPYLLAMKARLEDREGRFEEAVKSWRKVLDSGRATYNDYNNAAWSTLFRGKATEQADIDLALQAVQMSNSNDEYALFTLATLYANAGRSNEAQQTLRLAVDKRVTHSLEAKDYLIIGRIAELYGLDDLARETYDHVTKSPDGSTSTVWHLAQKRRAGLGKVVARK